MSALCTGKGREEENGGKDSFPGRSGAAGGLWGVGASLRCIPVWDGAPDGNLGQQRNDLQYCSCWRKSPEESEG